MMDDVMSDDEEAEIEAQLAREEAAHEELMRKLRAEQEAELAQEDSTNESLSAKLAILQKKRMNFEDDSDNLLAQIQEKREKRRRNLFDEESTVAEALAAASTDVEAALKAAAKAEDDVQASIRAKESQFEKAKAAKAEAMKRKLKEQEVAEELEKYVFKGTKAEKKAFEAEFISRLRVVLSVREDQDSLFKKFGLASRAYKKDKINAGKYLGVFFDIFRDESTALFEGVVKLLPKRAKQQALVAAYDTAWAKFKDKEMQQLEKTFDDSFKPKLVAPPAQKETQVKAKVNKKDTPEWLQKRQMSSATYQIRKQMRKPKTGPPTEKAPPPPVARPVAKPTEKKVAKPAAKKKVKKLPKKKPAKPAAKETAKPTAKKPVKAAKSAKKVDKKPVKAEKKPEAPVDEDEFVEAEYQGGLFTAVITSTETKKADRKIFGKAVVKQVTFFVVTCFWKPKSELLKAVSWKKSLRFSSLLKLHKIILSQKKVELPPFPAKTTVKNVAKDANQFLEDRKIALHRYLQKLLRVKGIMSVLQLAELFGLRVAVRGAKKDAMTHAKERREKRDRKNKGAAKAAPAPAKAEPKPAPEAKPEPEAAAPADIPDEAFDDPLAFLMGS